MSKCWYCNEELTTANYCDEHIGICTKCYGSMFQVSNEFVKGLMDKIADLEAKLAESEKQKQHYKDWLDDVLLTSVDHESYYSTINEYEEENKYFKKQLAEKDEEIEDLKAQRHIYLNRSVDDCNKITMLELELQHKDREKISFAVEQLEKVKEDKNLYEIMFEYLNNQGVKIKGVDYWCLLDVPDDIKNNSIEFEQQFKEVYKSMFDTYFDGIIYDLTYQHEDKGE